MPSASSYKGDAFYAELVRVLTTRSIKPYKEESVKPAYSQLKAMFGGRPLENLDFLMTDKERIKDQVLGSKAVSTRRSMLFTLRNVADAFGRKDILAHWGPEFKAVQEGEGKLAKGEVPPTQQGMDKTWDDILAKTKEYTNDYAGSTDGLLAALYTMFPPRRNLDYSEMKLTDDPAAVTDKTHNWLLIQDPEHMVFVFNRYKTDGVYHTQTFDVPDDLMAIIRTYLVPPKNPSLAPKVGDYLLQTARRNKMGPDDITETLHEIFGGGFRLEVNGRVYKGISTQQLRHLYINKYNDPKYAEVIKTMFGDASAMGHSVITQQEVYKRAGGGGGE